MKLKNRIVVLIVSICLFVSMFSAVGFAASGSLGISSASGNVGSTVTISGTVKCSGGAIGAATVVLSYDPSALQYMGGSGGTNGGSGSVKYAGFGDGNATSLNFSMTFKILKEGSHSISGTADGYNFNEEQLSIAGASGKVTGKVPDSGNNGDNGGSQGGSDGGNNGNNTTTPPKEEKPDNEKKSNNSKLSSLKVYPGTLSPAFSADTRSYTVNVPKDTTEVSITATPQDAKARVAVSGGKNLKPGENSTKVVVTAEDGSASSYVLTIVCEEEKKEEEVRETIKIDEKTYFIDESFTDEQIPAGFVRGNVSYKGKEYSAVTHSKGNMQLLYLSEKSGGNAFFIYDKVNKAFYPFLQIQISEVRYIIPLPFGEHTVKPEQMEETVLTLQEKEFHVWREQNQEFYILNAMSGEGTIGLYQYDSVDATYQRYVTDDSEQTDNEENTNKSKILGFLQIPESAYEYIIIGLVIAVLALLITVICLAIKRKKKGKVRRRHRRGRRKRHKKKVEE